MRPLLAAAVLLGLRRACSASCCRARAPLGCRCGPHCRARLSGTRSKAASVRCGDSRAIDWLLLGGLLLVAARWRARWSLVLVGLERPIWPRPPRWRVTRASRVRRQCSFPPTFCTSWRRACGWGGSRACCSRCRARPAGSRALSAAGCCSRRSQRFSPVALGAVVAIAVTGVIQAYIDVRSVNGLLHTTYGQLIVVKVVLLASLIGSAGSTVDGSYRHWNAWSVMVARPVGSGCWLAARYAESSR